MAGPIIIRPIRSSTKIKLKRCGLWLQRRRTVWRADAALFPNGYIWSRDNAPDKFMKMNGSRLKCFAFYGNRNACGAGSPSARLPSDFTRTYGGSDHVTGQADFEAETHNQSRRREGA